MKYDLKDRIQKLINSIISGGTASIITQPFEVIKTVQLCNPNNSPIIQRTNSIRSFIEASKQIYYQNKKGPLNFFRGASVGFFRQALGFSIYSQLLEEFNFIFKDRQQSSSLKYVNTALIAGASKVLAIAITCPLIVLKTRLELVIANTNQSFKNEVKIIIAEKGYFRGLNGVISRELSFSFLKQIFEENHMFQNNTFIAPYISGILGVVLSQPFEVIRNRMMIQDVHLLPQYRYSSLLGGFSQIIKLEGTNGLFNGLIPRLVRKPINTGISWGIYELLKKSNTLHQF